MKRILSLILATVMILSVGLPLIPAVAAEVAQITDLTHEIVELELRIKLLKAGA